MTEKNLIACGSIVMIRDTMSPMDGRSAKVIGIIAEYPEVTFYILEPIDFSLDNGYIAFQLISSCFDVL